MRTRVVILDMQPITPAVGGGRQRLLGLYHALGPQIDAVYVGSYDWPGESFRDQQLTPGLREICVPLSDAHHAAAKASAERLDGRVVIDLEFHHQVALSPGYLEVASREIALADVVVFSHPWCFPPLQAELKPHHLVVYDSHNVEVFLRSQLFDGLVLAEPVLRGVAEVERDLLERCHLVYCCSTEEVGLYRSIFGVPLNKLRVAPNGTFTRKRRQQFGSERKEAVEALRTSPRFQKPLVVFMGSQYGPNTEAGRYIVDHLAHELADVEFVVIGGLGSVLDGPTLAPNVHLAGVLEAEDRDRWLLAADLAINPMASGAGTNIKMFDFLAAGLPVVSTAVGARGIAEISTPDGCVEVVALAEMGRVIRTRIEAGIEESQRRACLDLVDRRFSWERISESLGRELQLHARAPSLPRPQVAIFTTWGIACGIAGHGHYLAEGFRDAGFDPVIIANEMAHHQPVGFKCDLRFPVRRLWHWDNLDWRDGRVDLDALESMLGEIRPVALIIQHHSAFLPQQVWLEIVKKAKAMGIRVILECHDAANLAAESAKALQGAGASIVVHSLIELGLLQERGVAAVSMIPLGVRRLAAFAAKPREEEIVVGGFGFLRPYKGIALTLEALVSLAREDSSRRFRYRGSHALYPGEEGSEYVDRCLKLAASAPANLAVEINTAFIDDDELAESLSQCDFVMLAYAPSREGGSAAASMAIASGVPLVCTPSAIFDSLKECAVFSRGFEVKDIAEACRTLIDSPQQCAEWASKVKKVASERRYEVVARMLLA